MRIIKIKYTACPVPLNERLTVVPVDYQAMHGGANFVSSVRKAGKRRVTHVMRLTYKYSSWMKKEIKNLQYSIAENKITIFTDSCVALLIFTPPDDHHRHDSDGIVKGPFDVLTRSGIIKDDYQIKNFMVVQTPPKDTGALTLYLAGEYTENDFTALMNLVHTVCEEVRKEKEQNNE